MKFPDFMSPRGKRSVQIRYVNGEGKRQFETIKAETMELAIEKATRELKIRNGDIAKNLPVSSHPNTVTFASLCEALIKDNKRQGLKPGSQTTVKGRIRLHIVPHFGEKLLAKDMTKKHIDGFIDMMQEEGINNGGINRKLETIRRVFKLAIENGDLYTMPKVKLLPEDDSVRQGFYELDQLQAICEHLPKHLIPPVCFGYITGWRQQEVMNLTWGHVHEDGVWLEKTETKNKKRRCFPWVPPLRKLINYLAIEHGRNLIGEGPRVDLRKPLFPVPGGKKSVDRFDKAWGTANRKAGMPVRYVPIRKALRDENGQIIRDEWNQMVLGEPEIIKRGPKKGQVKTVCRAKLFFHDFRRTAYRNLLRQGQVPSVAQHAVGWINAMTATRYDFVSKADLDALEARFNLGGDLNFWEAKPDSCDKNAISCDNSQRLLPQTTDSERPRGDSNSRPAI